MPVCHGVECGSGHWAGERRGRQVWPRHQGTGEWKVKNPSLEVMRGGDAGIWWFQVPRACTLHCLIDLRYKTQM